MTTFGKLLAVAVLGTAFQVMAIPFNPTYLSPPRGGAPNPTDQDVADELEITLAQLGSLLSKSDGAVGDFSYSIVNSAPPAGERTATITYAGALPGPALTYIVVKDGLAGWTLWDASAWNPAIHDSIIVDNRDLWNPPGNSLQGISHIAIYGNPRSGEIPPPPSVPDGGTTLLLLGAALGGFGVLRRKLA
jgi:hypothetical protein